MVLSCTSIVGLSKETSHHGNTLSARLCASSSALINPRRACAARVTVVVVCVCHSFILSVMRELTSPVIDRVNNKLTYPAADGGQKICGIFSETALFKSYGVKKPTS